MKIYIVSHTLELIEDFKRKHPTLKTKFILVGEHDIQSTDDIIVAKQSENNIEYRKYLCSYTAWHLISKNGLVEPDEQVAIFEYDVDVLDNDVLVNVLGSVKIDGTIGFAISPLNDPIFFNAAPVLLTTVKDVYDIDVVDLLRNRMTNQTTNFWTSSSNHIMTGKYLNEFVEWYTPIADKIWEETSCAHVHERSLIVFNEIKKYQTLFMLNLIEHAELRSHNIKPDTDL